MKEGPSNYICKCRCHTDENYTHEGHCCFVCPKCKENIVAHLYNEHKHKCRGKKRLNRPVNQEVESSEPEKNEERVSKRFRLNRPPSFGSTRSRHRTNRR